MLPTPRNRLPRVRGRRFTIGLAAAMAAVTVTALPTAPAVDAASPAELAVTTTADGGPGSLRAAITAANGDLVPSADEIVLGPGTFVLDIVGNDDTNAKGDLDILQPLTIRGAGSGETIIDATAVTDRAFMVLDAGELTLIGVTVQGGYTLGAGAGVRVHNESKLTVTDSVLRDNFADQSGGAISTEGALKITRSAFIDNEANNGFGGAIRVEAFDGGTVGTIEASEFSGNSSDRLGGAIHGRGVFLSISDTTFSGNSADNGTAVFNDGGAIQSRKWRLDHVTVTQNTVNDADADPDAAVTVGENGETTLTDSIVVDNVGGNCVRAFGEGEFVGTGANLVDDDTCGIDPTHFTNIGSAEPGLEALQDNGGPTRTHALWFDSPAVHMTTCAAGTFDQRGIERPTAAGWCDVGAYEHSISAEDDRFEVGMQDERWLNVLENDLGTRFLSLGPTFPDGSLSVVAPPSHGAVRLLQLGVFYRGAIGYSGMDSFTYQVCRGDECSTATVTIDVQGFTPSEFVPLAPQRILDTRITGPKPTAGTATSLTVMGVGGVPAEGVTAVVLNVTATDADAPGYVKVYPTGLAEPTVSSLNLESAGQTIPNLVTVSVGVGGSIELVTQSGAHLIADVAGYYRPRSGLSSGRFQAVEPARLLDTRTNDSGLAADATRDLVVTGVGGVPVQASAVVLNVTATDALAAGYVTVWPAGIERPVVSNLNVNRPGQTIPNLVIVPVGADGKVSIYSQSGTDLVVDVTGWFTDEGASGSQDGLFVPTPPVRVLDTRLTTALTDGQSVVAAAIDPEAHATAVVLNVTATESTAPGYVTVWPAGGPRPLASNVNVERAGQTIPNAAIVGVDGLGQVELFTQSATHLVVDVAGYYILGSAVAP